MVSRTEQLKFKICKVCHTKYIINPETEKHHNKCGG
jgi:hypothetical protein